MIGRGGWIATTTTESMFGDDGLNVKMADVERDLENVRGVWNFGEIYRGQMAKTNHFVAFKFNFKESTGAFTLGSEWGDKPVMLVSFKFFTEFGFN